MKAYSYNENGIFNGVIDCDIDPLETKLQEKVVWLLPARATFDPAPECDPLTQYPQWSGEEWAINEIITVPVSVPELELTNAERREQAYQSMLTKTDGMNLIFWEGKAITVDQANKVYLEYAAEGSTKASEIQALIIPAKTYIRELYPNA